MGDRSFLLYYLRGITHGNVYEFIYTCDECEKSSSQVYDLNTLSTRYAQAGDKEPFKVRLPVASEKMGVDVHAYFRLLRARDVDRLAALNRIMHSVNGSEAKTVSTRIPRKQGTVKIENVKIDNSITENLASLVVSVDGITDPDLISKFLTNCHMGDSIAIRQALSDNTPGVDVLIEITCPHCDAKSIRPLPLTETFFRPKATVVD
jgi:hypothetical protein